MFKKHYSDCTLHSGPAFFPVWCTCGGIKDGTQSNVKCYRLDYILIEALKSAVQLWKARIIWRCENRASWLRFLLEVAKHLVSDPRRSRILANVARRDAERIRNEI